MDPEKLQQAWQSQSCTTFGANPELSLRVARLQRRVYFLADLLIVSFFLAIGARTFVSAFRDIERGWPWLFYCGGLAWVVGYILFHRWRRRRNAAHYDKTMLAHVEKSIDDIEGQMRRDQNAPWWYLLPIALGCMIPPVLFFAMDDRQGPFSDALIPFLLMEGTFAATFVVVYLVMEFLRRIGLKGQLQELDALRALRDSLLNTDE